MNATMLPDRAVVRLSGEDVRGFLQGLMTNDVGGALPVYAGLLTPQGKTMFDFLVWANGDDALLDCEASQADALTRRLKLYRLRRAIEVAVDPALAVHWSPDGTMGDADPRHAGLGRRWIDQLGGTPAAHWLAHRLALGIVEGVAELGNETTLWLETNAREQNGVSFTKGCYVGQENTARMHHRGKVNRRLAVVAATTAPVDARAFYPELGLAVVRERIVELGDQRVDRAERG